MIVKGAVRSDGGQLAQYLLYSDKNDRAEVVDQTAYNGLDLDTVLRAFEAEAIGTRCAKPLYHAVIAPAAHDFDGEPMTAQQLKEVLGIYEKHLGFEGLPRVVIVHRKHGNDQEHYHVVWSRLDKETGKARDYKHNYAKQERVSAEIARRFGLKHVQGVHVDRDGEPIRDNEERRRSDSPLSYAEQRQEERGAKPKKERQAEITALWQQTRTGREFRAALEGAGYTLAKGERRNFVVVDAAGEVHSLARQIIGANAADVKARFADINPSSIPTVQEVREAMRRARAERPRSPEQPDSTVGPEQAHQRAENRPSGPAQPQQSATPPVNEWERPDGRPFTDPDRALADLTRQHSTFTQRDLARYAREHSKSPEQEAMLIDAVLRHPDLVALGEDRTGRERFTSRDTLRTELRMEDAASDLAKSRKHGVRQTVREAVPGIDKLATEQRAAYEHVLGREGLALVTGYAGTGKSRMLGAARKAWVADGYRVHGTALSGIAAESLQEGAGIESRTLHSLLGRLESGRLQLGRRDVIVLDEAGMVGSVFMEKLLRHARDAAAKVVLVGDAEQLQAIEAGGAFRALRDRHGAAAITEVRRQETQWQRSATTEFATGRTADALERYRRHGMVHESGDREAAKDALIVGWKKARAEKADQTHIILAYTRADVGDLNYIARVAYRAEGRLGEDRELRTSAGTHHFADGDRLYFTQNNTRLGVRNGTLGTIRKIGSDIGNTHVTVAVDNGKTVIFSLADYNHIAHGYAATVHRSQGVTVDRAHVLASRFFDRHAIYVGMTRHRDRADLYHARQEFWGFDRMAAMMSRDRTKDTCLDYITRGEPTRTMTESLRAAAATIWREIKNVIRFERETVRPDRVDPVHAREQTRSDTQREPTRPPRVSPAFTRKVFSRAVQDTAPEIKKSPRDIERDRLYREATDSLRDQNDRQNPRQNREHRS